MFASLLQILAKSRSHPIAYLLLLNWHFQPSRPSQLPEMSNVISNLQTRTFEWDKCTSPCDGGEEIET